MTNREYLQSLMPEELVKTFYFQCPYSTIMIVAEEKKGHSVCRKNEVLKTLKDAKEIAGFVFSGK